MPFWDDINASINNTEAQHTAVKVKTTYFKPERTFDRQAYFPKKNLGTCMGQTVGDFQKSLEINTRGTKTSIQIRYTRKQRTTIIHKMFETNSSFYVYFGKSLISLF